MQQHNAHEMEKSSQQSYHPQVRQPGTVPFIWEEKPGTAKNEWKYEVVPVTSVPSPSAKLVVSIPFNWEVEPGKPITSPSHPLPESPSLPLPPLHLAQSASLSPSTKIRGTLCAVFQRTNPFLSSSEEEEDEDDQDSRDNNDDDDDLLELDFRAFDSNTDDSYTSAPSLLENHTTGMSSAITVQSNDSLNLQKTNYNQHENWAISLSDSRGDSRRDTNVGTSVLEFLFPLLPPNSGFLNKVKYHKNCAVALPVLPMKENTYKSNCTLIVKRSHTLLELIQMSRRISCRRKAIQVKKQSFSMVID